MYFRKPHNYCGLTRCHLQHDPHLSPYHSIFGVSEPQGIAEGDAVRRRDPRKSPGFQLKCPLPQDAGFTLLIIESFRRSWPNTSLGGKVVVIVEGFNCCRCVWLVMGNSNSSQGGLKAFIYILYLRYNEVSRAHTASLSLCVGFFESS